MPNLSLTGGPEELRGRPPTIYEGTTQVHKMMQAGHALGHGNLNYRPETNR